MFKVKIFHFKDSKNLIALTQGHTPVKQILIKLGMNTPSAGTLPRVRY